eukprot:m.18958 g.18958  ORF g.18958 m.18958 type:complete len:185 (-) comp9788_c1_seq1:281-835(-)
MYWSDTASTCRHCHQTCAECTDGQASSCTDCSDGRSLLQGQCVTTCGDGYFRDASDGVPKCAACDAECGWTGCHGEGCAVFHLSIISMRSAGSAGGAGVGGPFDALPSAPRRWHENRAGSAGQPLLLWRCTDAESVPPTPNQAVVRRSAQLVGITGMQAGVSPTAPSARRRTIPTCAARLTSGP